MFFKTNYYALICSLPVLPSLEESPSEVDLNWFLADPFQLLSDVDKKIVSSWVFFDLNIMNVQKYSLNLESEMHPLGWSKEAIENDLAAEKQELLPDFVVKYLAEKTDDSQEKPSILIDILWRDAYAFASEAPLEFIRNKFRFDFELRTILAAYRCKQVNWQLKDSLPEIDGDEFVQDIIQNSVSSSDFGMGHKYEWAKKLPAIFEGNPLTVENRLDALRWSWLVENEPFMTPFHIEVILAFLFKLVLVDRWRSMSNDEARQVVERLEKMIAEKLEI